MREKCTVHKGKWGKRHRGLLYHNTVEAEALFEAAFSLFRGKLGDEDRVDIHGIRVVGGGGGLWGAIRGWDVALTEKYPIRVVLLHLAQVGTNIDSVACLWVLGSLLDDSGSD